MVYSSVEMLLSCLSTLYLSAIYFSYLVYRNGSSYDGDTATNQIIYIVSLNFVTTLQYTCPLDLCVTEMQGDSKIIYKSINLPNSVRSRFLCWQIFLPQRDSNPRCCDTYGSIACTYFQRPRPLGQLRYIKNIVSLTECYLSTSA